MLLLSHVTFWLVASLGSTVAVSFSLPFTSSVIADLFNVTLVTGFVGALTVTSHAAVLLPSAVVTVMVALPAFTAVTVPSATVATCSLLLLHVTVWLVAFAGSTVAVSFSLPPSASVNSVLVNVTPVTGTVCGAFTVTLHSAVLPPSAVAVMVAVPAALAVTLPLLSTSAISGLSLFHATVFVVASSGFTVSLSFTLSLTFNVNAV